MAELNDQATEVTAEPNVAAEPQVTAEPQVAAEPEMTMAELLAQADAALEGVEVGQIMEGTVVEVSEDEVVVNLGPAADGVIAKADFSEPAPAQLSAVVQPGDKVLGYVVRYDDMTGMLTLSKKRAEAMMAWDWIQESLDTGKAISIKGLTPVKGGLTGSFYGIRVFVPASQVSAERGVEMDAYAGLSLEVRVIEGDRENKRVVASGRVLEAEKKEKAREVAMDTLQMGASLTGRVTRLMPYGAFVDLQGVEGLLHISEISWKRLQHPSEVLQEGDQVQVRVLDIQPEKNRISLTLVTKDADPWLELPQELEVDSILEGRVTRLKPFGAFVELFPGIEGLVHLSQISEERIKWPGEVLKEDQPVRVRVLDVDPEAKRISLSMRPTDLEGEQDADYEAYLEQEEEAVTTGTTLGDLFKDKLGQLKF